MKKLLVSIFAAVCGLAANAEVTLSISDFTISAGESKTITVNLNRPDGEEVGSFACCILLPEGITINKNNNGKYNFSIPADCYDPKAGKAPTASSRLQNDGSVKVIAFSTDAIPFICPNGGAVLNVPITASSDLKSGEGEVKVYNQDITNCTGTKTYTTQTTQTTAKVTMKGGSTPEYVEIGGLRWATKNLGATTVAESAETAYGDYYAWGEVDTYYSSVGTTQGSVPVWKTNATDTHITGEKTGYDWSNYCGSSSFIEWSPAPYDATSKNLTSAYDVVNKALGGTWRMPTKDEFKNLADACNTGSGSYTVTKVASTDAIPTTKGIYFIEKRDATYKVPGMLFVDKDGASVFFPAAGILCETSLMMVDTDGDYWSSSLEDDNFSYNLCFSNNGLFDPLASSNRSVGLPVRPVSSSTTAINDVNASINSAQAKGVIKTANYIIKDGKKYNYAGQLMK